MALKWRLNVWSLIRIWLYVGVHQVLSPIYRRPRRGHLPLGGRFACQGRLLRYACLGR
jgi:hypothetical protein